MRTWWQPMSDPLHDSLSALVGSEHSAVYAYGVIAGNVHKIQRKQAIRALAAHRQIRTELVTLAEKLSIEVPSASDSYDLPTPVSTAHSALVAATEIEHSLCALWATSIAHAPESLKSGWALHAQECAQRAYSWSKINPSIIG